MLWEKFSGTWLCVGQYIPVNLLCAVCGLGSTLAPSPLRPSDKIVLCWDHHWYYPHIATIDSYSSKKTMSRWGVVYIDTPNNIHSLPSSLSVFRIYCKALINLRWWCICSYPPTQSCVAFSSQRPAIWILKATHLHIKVFWKTPGVWTWPIAHIVSCERWIVSQATFPWCLAPDDLFAWSNVVVWLNERWRFKMCCPADMLQSLHWWPKNVVWWAGSACNITALSSTWHLHKTSKATKFT